MMIRKKPKFFYQVNLLSYLLSPLSWIYGFFFFIRSFHLLKQKKFSGRVICVGNVVVGGTGKTPICIELGKILNERKKNFCYITKGYGRSNDDDAIIPKDHQKLFNCKDVGDETLLLASQGDVFVVDERKQAKCFDYDTIILDDGFFDNTIHKDINIAVFDGSFFIGNGFILPAGPLRFLLSSVRKADFVIITNPSPELLEKQKDILSKFVDRENILIAKLVCDKEFDRNIKYVAFAGLGENKKFFNFAVQRGANIVSFCEFSDHENYTKEKINKLLKILKDKKADRFLTTSKDATKLSVEFLKKTDILEIGYCIENVNKIFTFKQEN